PLLREEDARARRAVARGRAAPPEARARRSCRDRGCAPPRVRAQALGGSRPELSSLSRRVRLLRAPSAEAALAAPRRAGVPPFGDGGAPRGALGGGGRRSLGARFRALPRGARPGGAARRKARAAARRLHGRRARAPRRALAPGACGARAPRGRRPRG